MIFCCCTTLTRTLTIQGKGCSGNAIPGATVAVTGPGGFSDSCTLSGSPSVCSMTVPAAGTYSVTITNGSDTCTTSAVFGTLTTAVSVSCCAPSGKGVVTGQLKNDCVVLSGFTIQAIQSGSVVASTTTDGSGNFSLCVATSSTTIKAVGSGLYQDTTSSAFTPTACATVAPSTVNPIVMKPISGYAYGGCCAAGNGPIPGTLTLTDPSYSTASLTASSTGTITAATWSGSQTVSYPGCTDPPNTNADCLPVSGVEIRYLFGGCALTIIANSVNAGTHDCPRTGTDDAGREFSQTITLSGTISGGAVTMSGTSNHIVHCGGGITLTVTG